MDNTVFNPLNGFNGQNHINQLGFSGNFGNNNGCNCGSNNHSCGCSGSGSNDFLIGNLGANSNDTADTTRENLQRNLANYIGRRVTCEFCHCGNSTRKTGVLSCVGSNFITLTGSNGSCLLCDTAGLNFVTVCG